MKNDFSIIVAVDSSFGIGKNGIMPWSLPGDLKHFKEVTCSRDPGRPNAVVMGRKTWESLPSAFRPLPGRINAVVTRQKDYVLPDNVRRGGSLLEALTDLRKKERNVNEIFVIGGAQIFAEAMTSPECHGVYLTEIEGDFACDTFFPAHLLKDFARLRREGPYRDGNLTYYFSFFKRKSLFGG